MEHNTLKWPPVWKEALVETDYCNLIVPESELKYKLGDLVQFQTTDDQWDLGKWEVCSIRHTTLTDVTQREWKKAIFLDGPEQAQAYYMKYYKKKLFANNAVKVVSYRRCTYSLEVLNQMIQH